MPKLSSTSRKKLSPILGEIEPPVDVRSKKDIPKLENLIQKGPITFVVVYADWCGHCKTFMGNTWNELKTMKNRKNQMASVHFDQLENTSLRNSKIKGYPSVLVVGNDGVPATFPDQEEGGETNAMPYHNDRNVMTTLLSRDATAAAANVSTMPVGEGEMGDEDENAELNLSELPSQPNQSLPLNAAAESAAAAVAENAVESQNLQNSLMPIESPLNTGNEMLSGPPDQREDVLASQEMSQPQPKAVGGGSLLASMAELASNPSVLAAAAVGTGAVLMAKKKTRRRGRTGRKRTKKVKGRARQRSG